MHVRIARRTRTRARTHARTHDEQLETKCYQTTSLFLSTQFCWSSAPSSACCHGNASNCVLRGTTQDWDLRSGPTSPFQGLIKWRPHSVNRPVFFFSFLFFSRQIVSTADRADWRYYSFGNLTRYSLAESMYACAREAT